MKTYRLPLRQQVTCPHCWGEFAPEETLWVAEHPDLVGDAYLGETAEQRFLPSRFTPDGQAIDVRGHVCKQLACPKCHLGIPRAILELPPLFVSVIGAPSSGKSYFIACMVRRLREILASRFHISLLDADPEENRKVVEYENILFSDPDFDELVTLPKTQPEVGDLYHSVNINDREMLYPQPFVFTIQPHDGHPYQSSSEQLSFALCLYDNAGEHFLTDRRGRNDIATKHLAHSKSLLFLFDPTQHPKFRSACRGKSSDPQLEATNSDKERRDIHRQDQVLSEAARRIRDHRGLRQNEKDDRLMIVVVTKFDAWKSLMHHDQPLPTLIREVNLSQGERISAIDLDAIGRFSSEVRKVLNEYATEMVTTVEAFSANVVYLPVSALGRAPEAMSGSGALGIRPCDIRPYNVEIPILYALSCVTKGLVQSGSRR